MDREGHLSAPDTLDYTSVCQAPDCFSRAFREGLCRPHHDRHTGKVDPSRPIKRQGTGRSLCSLPHCPRPVHAESLCRAHRARKAKQLPDWDAFLHPRAPRGQARLQLGTLRISKGLRKALRREMGNRGLPTLRLLVKTLLTDWWARQRDTEYAEVIRDTPRLNPWQQSPEFAGWDEAD